MTEPGRLRLPAAGRELAVDLALLVGLKAAIGVWVLRLGFTHVSDDDYARVVIAELFAHAPKLDPSGTSWLPLPFWVTGGVMMASGRSLETARAVAAVLGVASVVPVYLALRALGVGRVYRMIAVTLAMATPWNAWLGVATVPEGITGALIGAGALLVGVPRARVWGAVALGVAALSRYEAWPVCAVMAVAAGLSAVRTFRAGDGVARREWIAVLAAVVAPLLWMAWNAYAHGSPLHFVARVAAYRRAMGLADAPLARKVLDFPLALVTGAVDVAIVASVGALGMIDREMRARWTLPLVATATMLTFLVWGDLRDGAPTHHPERALVGAWWVLAAFGVDGVRALVGKIAWARPRREAWVVAGLVCAAMAWGATLDARWRRAPARAQDERREAQVAKGEELRAKGVDEVVVVPCAYEHFALMAAYGAPERVTVEKATGGKPTEGCPAVEIAKD